MLPREEGAVICTCGHDEQAHLHYREGLDCSKCDCRWFTRPWRDVLLGWIKGRRRG